MIKPTHIAFSTACSASALLICKITGLYDPSVITKLGLLAVSGFASLLPDIDEPNSWAGRKFCILLLPFWCIRFLIRLIAYIIPGRNIKSFSKSLSHRHITHYFETYIILYAIVTLLLGIAYDWHIPAVAISITAFSAIGFASHILGDVIFGGIYSPLFRKKLRITRFTTSSAEESICRLILVAMDAAVVYKLFVLI